LKYSRAIIGFLVFAALPISCSDRSSPSEPPGGDVGLATIVVDAQASCTGWSNVPIYAGPTLVGSLSMPGRLEFRIEPGVYQLRACSASGFEILTIEAAAGFQRTYSFGSTMVYPSAPACD